MSAETDFLQILAAQAPELWAKFHGTSIAQVQAEIKHLLLAWLRWRSACDYFGE